MLSECEESPPTVASYLLVLADLHGVLVLLLLGSGEARGQRGGSGAVQDGGSDKLVPLPAALPLCHGWVQTLLQSVCGTFYM